MDTMKEIEAKFYVNDLKQIEVCLRKLKARLIQPRTHETNIRFDTPKQDLRRENRVLRLRKDDEARMTYKGPSKKSSGVLSRTEIEFVVEDFEKAKQFLESLGFQKLIYYEKYRTTYQLGRTHVMLDEMPYGGFVEIEGTGEDSIHRISERLGLNWGKTIATSYHALFERVCKARRLKIKDLSFKNFRGLKITPGDLGVRPADS